MSTNSGDADPLGALIAPGNVQEGPHADHSSEHPPLHYKFPTTRYFINLRERANKIIMSGRLTQAEVMLLTTFGDLLVHLEHLEAVAEKRERKSKGDGTKVPSLPVVESFDAPPGMQGQNGKSMLQISDNTPSQDWKFGKPNLSKPEPDTNNNIWGAWGAAEEETAKKGTQFDPSDNVQEGNYGDHESEYEEPSEQDRELPSRNIQSAPFGYRNTLQDPALKARYDLLVQGGTLISEEIQLLEASDGNTLLTLLKHFEILASKRAFGAGANGLSAPKGYPYREVHVLLLEWEEDDLGVDQVVNELMSVFKNTFGFESVQSFKIPSRRSYKALDARLQGFTQQNSSEQNLLIVYYSGHGFLDLQNRMHWAAKSEYECPKLDWYALQVGLERTESDVLILLDACCSAGASNLSSGYDSNQGGRTEIIAACGFDEVTNGESFTRVLIGELKRMAKDDCNFDQQISALQLHGRMLESMRYQNLPESDDPGIFLKSDHRFSTPVYMSLTRDHSQPSIPLKRFRPQVARSRGSSIRSIGSSINNGPRQRPQIKPHEVEDIAGPTSADHPKSPNPAPDSAAPAGEPTWVGVPYPPSLLETPEEPEPAELELLLNKERQETRRNRIRMVESGEITRWESKRLEEDPEMSALGVRLMLLEVERRISAKRDARLSLSSHMA